MPLWALRMPSGTSPVVARLLASHVGNAAFGQVVMRAPRVAADAATAARLAPTGPLAQMRAELDDVDVDEDKCIRLLGQLGSGERTLVGRDHRMMQQMANAFSAAEMARAVEHVDIKVKWQMYWLSRADDLDKAGQAVLSRLLNGADANALGELISWGDVRRKVQRSWLGNPLLLPATVNNAARTRAWLATAGFMAWAKTRAGVPAVIQWVAANDPAASLAALQGGAQLDVLLRAMGGQPVARPALRQIFLTATTADLRRRLYEIRFGGRASGTIDWMVNGERLWRDREMASGTGGDLTSVRAAVAGGGPRDVSAVIAADSRSPLAELRDELDDTFVNEDRCLVLIGQLNDREAYLLTRDRRMMAQMAAAFNGSEIARALERVGRFMQVKDALAFVEQADESGAVPRSVMHLLIGSATAQQLAETVGFPRAFAALKEIPGVRASTLTPLLVDAPRRDHVVRTYRGFLEWVVATPGEASAILRLVSTTAPAGFFGALRASGQQDRFIDALPRGSAMPPADRAALRLLFLSGTHVPMKIAMLNRRYNLRSTSEDTTYAGAGNFESATLDRIWDVLARVPEQDFADNDWLTTLTRRTNPTAPTPQGVTGSNRVTVGYDPSRLGDVESGAFTDPADQMRGTNLFDTTLLHEMAHASDRKYHWTRDGGPFDTNRDLGAWQNHGLDYSAIVDELAAGTSLAATFRIASELADVKRALTDAMSSKSTNAETGFRNLAGATYGVGADRWKPLWLRVSAHPIVAAIQDGQAVRSPWNNPPAAVGNRIYHDTDYRYWASYVSATRAGGKLSRYQFRAKEDFFAEIYATYYETAPANPGRLVAAWNVQVYQWFRDNVDRGQETRAAP